MYVNSFLLDTDAKAFQIITQLINNQGDKREHYVRQSCQHNEDYQMVIILTAKHG